MNSHIQRHPVPYAQLVMIGRASAQQKVGLSTGGFNAQEKLGLMPEPVKISAGRVAWIEAELDAVLMARAAGWDDDQVRQLVSGLMVDRVARVAEFARHLSKQPPSSPAAARVQPASLRRRSVASVKTAQGAQPC